MTVAGQITDERLAEMLVAAETATPGPRERHVIDASTYRYVEDAEKAVARDQADADFNAFCDPQTITALLTELQHRRAEEAITTVTTRAGACMWAEVVDGSPFQWECYEADGRGEASNHVTIELTAATFAVGTKLAIYEPGFFPDPPALAASPPSPASGVRVKALEWHRRDAQMQTAETIIGKALVWTHHDADGDWYWQISGVSKGVAASEADAIAALISDYEARILSALGEHP